LSADFAQNNLIKVENLILSSLDIADLRTFEAPRPAPQLAQNLQKQRVLAQNHYTAPQAASLNCLRKAAYSIDAVA
jgi:hypothetical protein